MADGKHTPGPYTIGVKGCPLCIVGAEGVIMAAGGSANSPRNVADMERIKLALSCHDDLLAACELASEDWADCGHDGGGTPLPTPEYITLARAAIAKAKGGEGS